MPDPSSLDAWLAHCERLHPKTIDLTLERVCAVRDRLGLRFAAPVVAVNADGTTISAQSPSAR